MLRIGNVADCSIQHAFLKFQLEGDSQGWNGINNRHLAYYIMAFTCIQTILVYSSTADSCVSDVAGRYYVIVDSCMAWTVSCISFCLILSNSKNRTLLFCSNFKIFSHALAGFSVMYRAMQQILCLQPFSKSIVDLLNREKKPE